jgi:hypothetical protein
LKQPTKNKRSTLWSVASNIIDIPPENAAGVVNWKIILEGLARSPEAVLKIQVFTAYFKVSNRNDLARPSNFRANFRADKSRAVIVFCKGWSVMQDFWGFQNIKRVLFLPLTELLR